MNILAMCDRALVAYIIQEGAGTANDVWPAKRSEIKALPETICYCHHFEPCADEPYSGNWDVQAYIEVRTDAVIGELQLPDEPRQAAADRTSATFALFYANPDDQSGLARGIDITNAARATEQEDLQEFTVINCRVVAGNQDFNPITKSKNANSWIDVLHLELTCCAKNVS